MTAGSPLRCWRGGGIRRASPARAALRIASGLILLLALGGRAEAHEEPYSYLDLHLDPHGLRGRVAAHVVDLAHESGLSPDSLLRSEFVAAHLPALQRVLDQRLHVKVDGRVIHPVWGSVQVTPDRKLVAFEWTAQAPHPIAQVEVTGPLFPWDPPHETYLNIYEGDAIRHQDLLDRNRTSATFYSGTHQGTLAVVRTFVVQGVHHIFIGPDHILFIVGLLLLGGGLARLLKIVTAFTIAHSITLALATTGLVTPPSRWIEPAIALSIVYVGVETLIALGRQHDRRAPIAFAFGLIHGFGFASVLRDFGLPSGALGWSLAAFNVGVEIGQMCIVLAVAPALAFLRNHRPVAARRVVSWGAACIIAAGAFWFVQRILAAA